MAMEDGAAGIPGAIADSEDYGFENQDGEGSAPVAAKSGPKAQPKPVVMTMPSSPSPVSTTLESAEAMPRQESAGSMPVVISKLLEPPPGAEPLETVSRRKKRRVSDPPVTHFFDGQDSSMSEHILHDRETRQVIRQLSGYVEVEDVMEGIMKNDRRKFDGPPVDRRHTGRIMSYIRNYQQVETERLTLKMSNFDDFEERRPSINALNAWQDDPLPDKAQNLRTSTKDSRRSHRISSNEPAVRRSTSGRMNSKEFLQIKSKDGLEPMDWLIAAIIGVVAFGAVIAMCVWAKEGLLATHKLGHHLSVNTRQGHIHAAMYDTPALINLPGTETSYMEVRLIGMATKDFAASHAHHRRLEAPRSIPLADSLRRLAATPAAVTGTITYRLYKCNTKFYEKTVDLLEDEEVEHFQDVDVTEELAKNAYASDPGLGKSNCQDEFYANVTVARSDNEQSAFLLQVVRMSSVGKHRQVIGIVIFVVTFIGIVSEKIHRSYSAFMGASATLCTLSAIVETPHLHTIAGMIDWGTLMLLFSMMILMRMLAVTGFFNWFAVKVVILSKQRVKVLFFALTNICGVLSMVLDNVTCVMLFGPLTYLLSKKMGLNPRYLYLSMTICATVGGTATLIGDPPNVVIGSKMKIDFGKFIVCNMPIVVVVMLPMCSAILWWRVKDLISPPGNPVPKLDFTAMVKENKITDMPMFVKLNTVLFAILLSLCLSPVHLIEPAWFTCMGMFACAILFERHHLGKYLEFVEWDTLLFFALLFVLVESLSELGVIRMLGDGIVGFIEVFPESSRMPMAIIIILWVSSIGSAFLESLPYTTTIVYVLIDMQRKVIPGVVPSVLVWPLSVGACVGGIGSIMGSSANLVCMAVAERCADKEVEKVQGGDFLKYGLPTMLILVVFAMFWQLILFVALEFRP